MGRRKGVGGVQGDGGGGGGGGGVVAEARLSFHAGIMLHDLQLPGKNSLEIPYIGEQIIPKLSVRTRHC